MREEIEQILNSAGIKGAEVFVPEKEEFGHYSTNVAMRLAKELKKPPMELAKDFAEKTKKADTGGFFEKIDVAPPGFINFWISKKALQVEFEKKSGAECYGTNNSMKGKTVMVEFTDPNPFKLFHIGHLMSNSIGESLSRLFEASGAKVIRANYQGDVGLHVAKAMLMFLNLVKVARKGRPDVKLENILIDKKYYIVDGMAYLEGNREYETNEKAKEEIIEINKKLYEKSDKEINQLYQWGREASLKYFEELYKRLGTKFDHYFFESEVAGEGLKIVAQHPEVFVKSDGAVVFRGEEHDLHTRVFVGASGLPTYEAKELGLNKKKFDLYPKLDLSIIVTGNEIVDYFKVLLRVMELILPKVAEKTRHVPHGMMRLPSGKMSSRTGDIISAESLLDQIKAKLGEYASEKSELNEKEREVAAEVIAVGAVKYSILKQGPGQDIVFDFEKSLSLKGDSAPYLQYTYARLRSILRKFETLSKSKADFEKLNSEPELRLIRKIFEFPDVILQSTEGMGTSSIANYLHKLASLASQFYETTPILKETDESRRAALLALVEAVSSVLKSGLGLLGIKTLEKI